MDKNDPMNQYTSKPRGFGSILKQGEKARKSGEWDEQAKFGRFLRRWAEKNDPDMMWRVDLSSGAARTPFMRNRISDLKSDDSFPDFEIYKPIGRCIGIQIEMKDIGVSAFLKNGSLSTQAHIQQQNRCHEKLREQGWFVAFASGAQEAKRVFLGYIGISESPFDSPYLPF